MSEQEREPQPTENSTQASDANHTTVVAVKHVAGMATTNTPSDGEALFLAEYATDLPLLTGYVDLLVGDKQRRFAVIMAVIDIALAMIVAIAAAPMWPIALVLAAIGIGMFWYRGNVCRMTATKMLRGLDPAELHRQVHVYADRVALVKDGGSADDFPISELTDVMYNDQLLVLAFGRSGVTVPHGSLTKGTYEGLLTWALEHMSSKSDTPSKNDTSDKNDTTPKEDAK